MQISIIKDIYGKEITIPAKSFHTNILANELVIRFNDDEQARENERLLKSAGFKTRHSDSRIAILEYIDFDIIVA